MLGLLATLLGLVFFITAMAGSIKTGGVIAEAHRIITTSDPGEKNKFIESAWKDICKNQQELCKDEDGKKKKSKVVFSDCKKSLQDNNSSALTHTCAAIWDEALKRADVKKSKVGLERVASGTVDAITFLHKTGTSLAINNRVSVVLYFFMCMAGLILLFIGLGLWKTGRVVGIAISSQNRLSLSLLQVLAWTTVLLSAYATYSTFNIGAVGSLSMMRETADSVSYTHLTLPTNREV